MGLDAAKRHSQGILDGGGWEDTSAELVDEVGLRYAIDGFHDRSRRA